MFIKNNAWVISNVIYIFVSQILSSLLCVYVQARLTLLLNLAYIRSLMARSNNKVLSESEIGDYEIILGLPYKVISFHLISTHIASPYSRFLQRQAIIYSNLGNVYCALEYVPISM